MAPWFHHGGDDERSTSVKLY